MARKTYGAKSKVIELKDLEKSLIKGRADKGDNKIILGVDDFKNGKLKYESYERLKSESYYIPFREELEIVVPEQHIGGFKPILEEYAVKELTYMKRERAMTMWVALLCFVASIAIIVFWELFANDLDYWNEIVIIVAWVFAWAATEKWFFDIHRMHRERFNVLQLLSAPIIKNEQ